MGAASVDDATLCVPCDHDSTRHLLDDVRARSLIVMTVMTEVVSSLMMIQLVTFV